MEQKNQLKAMHKKLSMIQKQGCPEHPSLGQNGCTCTIDWKGSHWTVNSDCNLLPGALSQPWSCTDLAKDVSRAPPSQGQGCTIGGDWVSDSCRMRAGTEQTASSFSLVTKIITIYTCLKNYFVVWFWWVFFKPPLPMNNPARVLSFFSPSERSSKSTTLICQIYIKEN